MMSEYAAATDPAEPKIRANMLAPVADALAERGFDIQALFESHSIETWTINNAYQEIPLNSYLAFFEGAAELSGDTFFGLRLGSRFRAESFGPMGGVFRSSTNLRTALARLSAYLAIARPGTRSELLVADHMADWSYSLEDSSIAPRRQDAEFVMSASCGFIRSILGGQWSPKAVHFEHPDPTKSPREREILHRIFLAPVLFGQPATRLVLTLEDLDRAGTREADQASMVEKHFRELIAETPGKESTAKLVGYLIARRIGHESLKIQDLAAEMGLSARTLQRRLAEEGVSIRSLVEKQRRQIAEDLLSRKSAPISTVARKLGYTEQAVLSRAFRQWKGSSPSEFRKKDNDREREK